MKKLLIFLFFSGYLCAQTTTPNLGMTKPAHNALNWDTQINANLDILDAKLACFGTGTVSGTIVYYNGATWVCLPGNTSGTKVLQETSVGVPSWATVSGTGTVTSVLGTANQITSDGSTSTPTLSIASTFTFPGTVTNNLSIFGSTTSAQLATLISNETGSGLSVFGTSPTIITPTIASFVNAAHDHSNAAGGGQISLATCCTGVLAVANGGSGTATPSLVAGTNISITGTWPDQVINSTGGGGGGTWGSITGTLSSQTDLQTALNLKANLASPTFTGTVVLPNSQILTTPTIASFTNATHAHNNAAGGGTLDAAVIATGLLSVSRGGTATATPSIVAGTNISVAGTWPNQTITATGITDPNAIPLSQKGAASGVASLDSATKVVEPAKTLVGDPAETDPGVDFFPSTDKSVSAAGHVHLYSDGGVLTASQDAQPGQEIGIFNPPLPIIGATYTIAATDKKRFLTFITNSAVITLPVGNTTTFKPGFEVTVKNDSFTTQTLTPTLPATIDGATSTTFTNFQTITLVVDTNLNWRISHFSSGRAYGAYEVFGNMTGSTTAPTRGVLVAAAIPSLAASILTSGTVAVARGGTNLGSGTSGGILGYTASGTLASSVALTLHALTIGGGAGATPTPLASLGTSTTLLHGAAAGDPTFSAVVEADQTLADNTTNDASTSKHGYLKKLNNDSTYFINGVGNWAVPTGGAPNPAANGMLACTGTACSTSSARTITAGSGISVTNGDGVSGNPTIAATGAASLGTFLQSWCNSTVGTGNGTLYILAPVENSTSSSQCNVTTSGAKMPIPAACTARNLYVIAGSAGAQAGSGVIAIRDAGGVTALTCTLGTGTTCNDTTHTVAFNAGDSYLVGVTTGQATDTTANIRASFQCN